MEVGGGEVELVVDVVVYEFGECGRGRWWSTLSKWVWGGRVVKGV